jgi:uncharacterized protein (DUF362 family)
MKAQRKETILISRLKSTSEIYECIRKGIASMDDLRLGSDSVAMIKPNLCCIRSYETGATTDPRVVEAIIKCLRNDYGIASIYVVESDASQMLADMAFKLLGYEKLAERNNVKLVNLSKSPFTITQFPENTFLKKIRFPSLMKKVNFFISVPKIKTHGANSFTATLKNQFGCNPYPNKSKFHKRLDDAIVDSNAVFKPNLVIVDGIIAMGGYRGPVDGVPIKMNTLIFGKDPVAVDHLISRIMGINPKSVRYLVEAERRGLGTTNYTTIGTIPWEFQRKFKIDPPRLLNLYNLLRGNA